MSFSEIDIDWKSASVSDVLKIINSGVNINKACRCPLNDPHDMALHPLIHAIRAGANLEIIQTLIDNGADVNCGHDNMLRETPFFHAIDRSDVNIIKVMIDAGAYMNATDCESDYQDSPLSWARTVEVVDVLIKSGSDVNIKRANSKSHVWQKNVHKNDEVVQALIDAGAQVNIQDSHGRLAIHAAVNSVICKELIVSANIRSTPLHNVCKRMTDNINTVKVLIDNGADINARDKEGNTCLHICASGYMNRNESYDLFQMLISNGADIHVKNNEGKKPTDMAR